MQLGRSNCLRFSEASGPLVHCGRQDYYNPVARKGAMAERRLAWDVIVLREAHLFREFMRLFWISSDQMGADPITKFYVSNAVFEASVSKHRLLLNPGAWVERPSQAGKA
jgi:hypothetical protein